MMLSPINIGTELRIDAWILALCDHLVVHELLDDSVLLMNEIFFLFNLMIFRYFSILILSQI